MKTTLPILAAAAVFSVASANAASYSVTASPNPVTGNVASYINVDATFATFDSSLGTLTSVTIELTGTQRADVTLENDTAFPVVGTAALSGNMRATVDSNGNGLADDSLEAIVLLSADGGSHAFGATDGTSGSGLDFHDFGTITSAPTVNDDVAVSGLAFYNGDGITTRTALVNATGGWSASGISDATLTVANFEADATVKITYTYDAVPEPSSALLGLLGAGFLVLRRKRA